MSDPPKAFNNPPRGSGPCLVAFLEGPNNIAYLYIYEDWHYKCGYPRTRQGGSNFYGRQDTRSEIEMVRHVKRRRKERSSWRYERLAMDSFRRGR